MARPLSRGPAQASEIRDPDARRTLLEIAQNYEQLAEQAERIRKTRIALVEPSISEALQREACPAPVFDTTA